mgnify:CR=1 FL=1
MTGFDVFGYKDISHVYNTKTISWNQDYCFARIHPISSWEKYVLPAKKRTELSISL